jgi:hypothetical protein
MHKLNLNSNSIYIGNWIYKKTTIVNSSQVFRVGRRPFLSIELNFWFGSHKDLEISGPSGKCEVDRLKICCSENRSIASRSIEVESTESWSIELLVVQIIDRSKCLGQFFIFSGSASNSENNQIALNVFSSIIQVFWTRFQLRLENKT